MLFDKSVVFGGCRKKSFKTWSAYDVEEKLNVITLWDDIDRPLLSFKTWEDYLDSLISIKDIHYLDSVDVSRECIALGHRLNSQVIGEKDFYRRRAKVAETEAQIKHPKEREIRLYSTVLNSNQNEELVEALSAREALNRKGFIQSIIFIRNYTRGGLEVSGYIDYAHRLKEDKNKDFWVKFFKNNAKLVPKPNDSGYYHWRHGTVRTNVTNNYMPLMSPKKGLVFLNRHDHKLVIINPEYPPGLYTEKVRIKSTRYVQIEIYDHQVRQRYN